MNTHTIVDTRTGRTTVLESNATTRGELRQELLVIGIETDGMSIQEGLTKTELVSDSTPLPTNVQYHGSTTNNLVFRITGNTKKIKSGAADLLNEAKENLLWGMESYINALIDEKLKGLVEKAEIKKSPYSSEEVNSFFNDMDNEDEDDEE